jgi:exonuclease III
VRLTLATWNINSVRLRIDLVARFLREQAPHVLCLQETSLSAGTASFPWLHSINSATHMLRSTAK